jgi:hypothetical protein
MEHLYETDGDPSIGLDISTSVTMWSNCLLFDRPYSLLCNSAALSAFCPTTLHCVLGNFEELSSDSVSARSREVEIGGRWFHY